MPTTAEVCDALCDVLHAGNEVHRCLAVQALGRIGNPRAVDALTACLMDEDEDVRVDAAEGLGLLGDGRACASLVSSLLGDPCSDVKISAVEALGRLGCRDAAPELRGLARQGDDAANRDDTEWLHEGWDDRLEIQVKAIDALARMGTVEAVPDIVDAIDDEMGQELSETGMKALARLGGPGIEALAHYLKAPDGRLRRRAAGAMAGVDSEAARGALAGALQDDWADVRLAAARGVASGNAAHPGLVPLFDDADPKIRAEMVRLCGRLYPERLDAMLDDPSDRVQETVVGLLAADSGPTPPNGLIRRLRIKLRGPSPSVAVAAAAALAALAPEDALEDLAEQLRDKGCPAAVRCAAARALADIGTDRAAHVLLQTIGDDERRVRLDAMLGLARMAADRRSEPARH
ncbi:MAG: HEAT repeat domain-containing protein, partial [Rhodospirillales bacterium]